MKGRNKSNLIDKTLRVISPTNSCSKIREALHTGGGISGLLLQVVMLVGRTLSGEACEAASPETDGGGTYFAAGLQEKVWLPSLLLPGLGKCLGAAETKPPIIARPASFQCCQTALTTIKSPLHILLLKAC